MKPVNPRILTVHGASSSIKFALLEAGVLHRLSPFDPEQQREKIRWAAAFHRRFPDLRPVACFDTAFHHDLPRAAQWLQIPAVTKRRERGGMAGAAMSLSSVSVIRNALRLRKVRL